MASSVKSPSPISCLVKKCTSLQRQPKEDSSCTKPTQMYWWCWVQSKLAHIPLITHTQIASLIKHLLLQQNFSNITQFVITSILELAREERERQYTQTPIHTHYLWCPSFWTITSDKENTTLKYNHIETHCKCQSQSHIRHTDTTWHTSQPTFPEKHSQKNGQAIFWGKWKENLWTNKTWSSTSILRKTERSSQHHTSCWGQEEHF